MTSNLGSRSINVKLTMREWFGVGVFIFSTAIGFASVYSQAKTVEAKAMETAQDLSEFKDKTNAKLEEIKSDTAFIRGVIGRNRPSGQ